VRISTGWQCRAQPGPCRLNRLLAANDDGDFFLLISLVMASASTRLVANVSAPPKPGR